MEAFWWECFRHNVDSGSKHRGGATDENQASRNWRRGSTTTGAAGWGEGVTPPPPSLFPRGLQQLLHIFDFTAIIAAATTPCCIVLPAG